MKILRTNLQELSDVEDKSIEADDPSYAEAKRFTKKLEKNLEDAFEEKNKFTDEFIKKNDKRENKPMYTPEMKKLKLSESLFEEIEEKEPKERRLDKIEGTIAKLLNDHMQELFAITNARQLKDKMLEIVDGSDLADSSGAKRFRFTVEKAKNTNQLLSILASWISGKTSGKTRKNEELDNSEDESWSESVLQLIHPFLSHVEELDYDLKNHTKDSVQGLIDELEDCLDDLQLSIKSLRAQHDELQESNQTDGADIKESIQDQDGWSDEIVNMCRPFFSEVEQLSYSINHLQRGSYGTGETVEDLINIFREVSQNAEDLATELEEADKDGSLTESLKEDFKLISDLSSYEPWSGAIETMDKINEAGKFDELELYLETIFPDGATIAEVNGLLWLNGEEVLSDLGIEEPEDE